VAGDRPIEAPLRPIRVDGAGLRDAGAGALRPPDADGAPAALAADEGRGYFRRKVMRPRLRS
jgi:hypothetical protein